MSISRSTFKKKSLYRPLHCANKCSIACLFTAKLSMSYALIGSHSEAVSSRLIPREYLWERKQAEYFQHKSSSFFFLKNPSNDQVIDMSYLCLVYELTHQFFGCYGKAWALQHLTTEAKKESDKISLFWRASYNIQIDLKVEFHVLLLSLIHRLSIRYCSDVYLHGITTASQRSCMLAPSNPANTIILIRWNIPKQTKFVFGFEPFTQIWNKISIDWAWCDLPARYLCVVVIPFVNHGSSTQSKLWFCWTLRRYCLRLLRRN